MKKYLTTLAIAGLLVLAGSSFAAEKKVEVKIDKPTPPSVKERVSNWEERLSKIETKMKADADLRADALAAAKKEMALAKKYAEQGKDSEAQEALIKVRHHAGRLKAINSAGPQRRMKMMRMRGGPGMGMGIGIGNCEPGTCEPGMGMGMGMGMCDPGMGMGMGKGPRMRIMKFPGGNCDMPETESKEVEVEIK